MLAYEQWESGVSREIRSDSVWKIKAYRFALFAADLTWADSTTLLRDRRSRAIADQLLRAVGSVSANIAEGFSRSSGRDRAHFYEYALGSAREGRDWYFKVKQVLGEEVAQDRIQRLTEVVRLLLTMVPDQRKAPSARMTKVSTQEI